MLELHCGLGVPFSAVAMIGKILGNVNTSQPCRYRSKQTKKIKELQAIIHGQDLHARSAHPNAHIYTPTCALTCTHVRNTCVVVLGIGAGEGAELTARGAVLLGSC